MSIVSMQLTIRNGNEADIPRIAEIVNAAYSVEDFIIGERTNSAALAEMMAKDRFLVGEHGGKIVASVYVELRGERGYFGMLAVTPGLQGQGVGRQMIAAAENFCRHSGCGFMDIRVLSLRSELLPFYRKLGYSETRTEEFNPPRGLKPGVQCHAIIMSKML